MRGSVYTNCNFNKINVHLLVYLSIFPIQFERGVVVLILESETKDQLAHLMGWEISTDTLEEVILKSKSHAEEQWSFFISVQKKRIQYKIYSG